jgi:hypothetical protein
MSELPRAGTDCDSICSGMDAIAPVSRRGYPRCGVVSNGWCDVSVPRGAEFRLSAAPLHRQSPPSLARGRQPDLSRPWIRERDKRPIGSNLTYLVGCQEAVGYDVVDLILPVGAVTQDHVGSGARRRRRVGRRGHWGLAPADREDLDPEMRRRASEWRVANRHHNAQTF